ncbi:phage tail tape measure protein [Metarhizobium album]|uniref:phage tail tape measure protein n=1 Tax=Metarhizobium album TaxID=2182425 RepID=UPI001FE1E83C|nr:phage tail tape measure protein [Rhizobium album]
MLNDLQRRQTAFMTPLRSGLGSLLALGAGYIGVTSGVDSTVGAAMRFESAFADVRKVVDGTDQQLEFIRQTIKQMSTELPIASEDMAALFAAAAESGIATADLKDFATMAARVGIAFDMSAGEAGESLAKLKTQLGLTVAETGDMADAINHLSNNMASKASDVTDFMLRVGAFTKIGGLAKEQTAALGSAMIAAGADPSTAATAMQNVVKAMTRGASAKKSQKAVAKALGLNLPQLAKDMQKDAPSAIKKVLAAIGKAPKDQHVALLSDFFGDEAKAFAPLIGNIGLLDQALDSVNDKAKYGGSAFREYVERANTTANVLQLLRNRVNNAFESFGESMLPSIKEAAQGVNDVLDTMGERATAFDKISTAFQGFMQGFAPDSNIRTFINDLGDLLFGKADGSAAADALGRIFAKFKQWGEDFRYFSDQVRNSPIVKFLAPLMEQGFKLMVASVGFAIAARSLRLLGSALYFLSGASTVAGILKTVAGIQGALNASTAAGGLQGAAATSGTAFGTLFAAAAGVAIAAGLLVTLRDLDPEGNLGGITKPVDDFIEKHTGWNPAKDGLSPWDVFEGLGKVLPGFSGVPAIWNDWWPGQKEPSAALTPVSVSAQQAMDNAIGARNAGIGGSTTDTLPGKTADDLGVTQPMKIDPGSIAALLQPSGTQDVRVTNQQPVSVNVSAPITITGVMDPRAAAAAATSDLGAKTKAAVESSLGGGGGF